MKMKNVRSYNNKMNNFYKNINKGEKHLPAFNAK